MQNLIPYVWQMVFANVFVKGWIINSDIQSLFYCSQEVLTLANTICVIGMCGLHVAFEGHISLCHVHGNNIMLMVPSMAPLHLLCYDSGVEVLYDLWCWC